MESVSSCDDSDEAVTVLATAGPILASKAVSVEISEGFEDPDVAKNAIEDSDSDGDSSNAVLRTSESDKDYGIEKIVSMDFSVPNIDVEKVLNRFSTRYENILAEFADVEIFLISLDGLLIELVSHKYLNWTLGGQSIVLAKQIHNFLNTFSQLGGRFKLVWFQDLIHLYSQDTVLRYVRSFIEVYLMQSPWKNDVIGFANPCDKNWSEYIHRLNPSFLILAVDNPPAEVSGDKSHQFSILLTTVALHALYSTVPIVYLTGLVINLCSVMCHRAEPNVVDFAHFEEFLTKKWDVCRQASSSLPKRMLNLSDCTNLPQLWARVIKETKKEVGLSKRFEYLASSVLIASLVCQNRKINRIYLRTSKVPTISVDTVADRRQLLTACSNLLESCIPTTLCSLEDLWDGRLIFDIYDELIAGNAMLPYRLQKEFAHLHSLIGLKLPLAVDTNERLLDPPQPKPLILDSCGLSSVKTPLLKRYVPECIDIVDSRSSPKGLSLLEKFNSETVWPFHSIEDELLKPESRTYDTALKWRNKQKQTLSKWMEVFAQSVEGPGSALLVDFSRTPRGFASLEEDTNDDKDKKKQQWQQKGKGGGGKGKKEPAKSKKDLILEASKSKKNEKLVEVEKQMVKFAIQQGKNNVSLLENILNKLELHESQALCIYEQAVRLMKDLGDYEGNSYLEIRRVRGVTLVAKLKQLFNKYWSYLDDRQKNFVNETWVSLGFAKDPTHSTYDAEKLSMKINLIYYQMAYAGELIDIQSDPQKDGRVTGFHPDAWQRQMLDVVDRNQSAVIVAPTSAGKTFVSYYCIERILRQSDDDMVIYVSPSKALVNQVAGSVYARFRNKTLSGNKSLFGVLTMEYSEKSMNCQVLITLPVCLERILLSNNPDVQKLVSKLKYVIFDEVHCISASPEAHIWEHLLLLIRCPFLALSATVSNVEMMHSWLQSAEERKKLKTETARKVNLITYGERYSELELLLQKIEKSNLDVTLKGTENKSVLEHFMPYGIYIPEKLEMFGIPADQQLTARQILDFYNAMSSVDDKIKDEFEPCKFFDYVINGNPVWLSRSSIRCLERKLKERFLQWLKEDPQKMITVLEKLGKNVKSELEYRSHPFNLRSTALNSIVPLVVELKEKEMLPAICFNDDREICERLAIRVYEYLEEEQRKFENTAEFKTKYQIKDEEKLEKVAKKMLDAMEAVHKAKKEKRHKDREHAERKDDERTERSAQKFSELDPLSAQRLRLAEVLERFKLRGRIRDEDLLKKIKERMNRGNGRNLASTKLLLMLFERGIGFHHRGLNAPNRAAVEILFRSGQLSLIFSTSTLALGVNMPCKTVIFGIDTMNLTPLQFRQMSGRAGRRGYDHSGTVIFMSIPTSKIRRLLTASLSTLRGNVPFTTSFILRLFAYIYQTSDDIMTEDDAQKAILTRACTINALLESSFVLSTRKDASKTLSKQLQMFFLFSTQILHYLDLLDDRGRPKGFASLVCHLSDQGPGNLVFIYLLQHGEFHRICKEITNKTALKYKLILIFAHLFTYRILPLSWDPNNRNSYPSGESKIFLEPLPQRFHERVNEYNKKVDDLYKAFIQITSDDNLLQGPIFSLTGNDDSSVSLLSFDVVRPLHDGFLFDESFIPTHPLSPKDHRGREIHLNAYAVDFWRNKSKKYLNIHNDIPVQEAWTLVNNFSVTLARIAKGLLAVGRPKDPFVEIVNELANEYSETMHNVFEMRKKQ